MITGSPSLRELEPDYNVVATGYRATAFVWWARSVGKSTSREDQPGKERRTTEAGKAAWRNYWSRFSAGQVRKSERPTAHERFGQLSSFQSVGDRDRRSKHRATVGRCTRSRRAKRSAPLGCRRDYFRPFGRSRAHANRSGRCDKRAAT